jgi:hypothetical protein
MKDLIRFWRSLEGVHGLHALPAFWELYCDPHFDLIRPHLRPTDMIGGSYPCPYVGRNGHCPRRVVDLEGLVDGHFDAICSDPYQLCPDVRLTSKDVVVQTLDIGSFTRMLADVLGIRWQPPERRSGYAWGIGLSKRRKSLNQPVFLVVERGQSDFRSAVLELLASGPGPFVLVAPTDQHRDVSLQEHFERRGISFISLAEQVQLDEEGHLVSVDPIESADDLPPTPVADRQRLMDAFRVKHDCTAPVIADEAEVHIRDLYKWIAGQVKDDSKKSKRIEAVLRRGLPARPSR